MGLLAGCATVEDTVDVRYVPTTASKMADAQPVTVTVTDGRTTDRTRISTKINGYGMEMAAIRANSDIASIVRAAAKQEFRNRGFDVDNGGRPVAITVLRFYNQYATGFFSGDAIGNVDLSVAVTDSAGAKLYDHTYNGEAKMSVQLANGSNAAESVANALRDAMAKMFADPDFLHALTESAPPSKPTS